MRLRIRGFLIALFGVSCLSAQQYTISTVAGGAPISTPIAGLQASIGFPEGGVADVAGNFYFTALDCVYKLDATGVLRRVVGNSRPGFFGDGGPAIDAQLYRPLGLAMDASGNLYIADSRNARVRKVSSTGIITTVAGNGIPGVSGDGGAATNAQIISPQCVAVDAAGNLYIGDFESYRSVRKVSAAGTISTVAGVTLDYVGGLAVDGNGNLYIADYYYGRILRSSAAGVVTTVAGGAPTYGPSSGPYGYGDGGPAKDAYLNRPAGLAFDGAGNLYIADSWNNRIRMISPAGIITTVAGCYCGDVGYGGDGGRATDASLFSPTAVAILADGSFYVVDSTDSRIRKVSAAGIITTAAGIGDYRYGSGDGGPANSAEVYMPLAVAADAGGNLYIADSDNRIRKVTSGTIVTVAGVGLTGNSGDGGWATDAMMNGPSGVALDAGGNLYVADRYNKAVREVSKAGIIATIAGSPYLGLPGDGGPATSATLRAPYGIAVDSAGNVYIADSDSSTIRKISTTGIITTVAGTGRQDNSGDGGPAASAGLWQPTSVAIDAGGNLYIADSANNRIRMVSPSGIITTIAGNGIAGYSGDGGLATSAKLSDPASVAIDLSGNLYIADADNNRIRMVSPSGIITTIAGNGGAAYAGDGGAATDAQLNGPLGVAVDSVGNIYVADSYNNAVRVLIPSSPSCTYSASPTSLQTPAAGGSLSLAITTGAGCGWAVSNLPDWIGSSDSPTGPGPATISLAVAPNTAASRSAQVFVAGTTVTVTQGSDALAVSAGGVVNGASYLGPVAPGSVAAVFGNFLLPAPVQNTSLPAPTNLGGLSLRFGGAIFAPLLFADTEQVDAQIPWELAGQSQTTVTAMSNGRTSGPQTVNLATYAPAIIAMNGQGTGQGAIVDANYRLLDWTNPAIEGFTVAQIYCTGLGPVTHQPPTGAPSPTSPLAETTTQPDVTFGGMKAYVLFSGLAPGYVGLYQVNAVVPLAVLNGNVLTVVLSIGGAQSNMVTIAAQ